MAKLKLTEDQTAEGITAELIHFVSRLNKNLPSQIEKDGAAYTFIKAKEGFYYGFISVGNYFLDEKNKPKLFDEQTVLAGKARYFLKHRESIIEKDIASEIEKIKKSLDEKASKAIQQFDTLYKEAYCKDPFKNSEDESSNILLGILSERYTEDPVLKAKQAAKQAYFEANPNYESSARRLKKLFDEKDYDSLYSIFHTDSLPLLYNANFSNEKEMKVLKQFFSSGSLEDTLNMIQQKGHLYSVSFFKIMKKYYI